MARIGSAKRISPFALLPEDSLALTRILDGLEIATSRREAVQGHGTCVGVVSSPTGVLVDTVRDSWVPTIQSLNTLLRRVSLAQGCDLRWTSLQINKNSVAAW